MAKQHRTTTSLFPQESTVSIARVALYARVSTLNGQDPEMQLRELRDYVSRRGWSITHEYIDQGVSGSKESRPALNDLMNDAQSYWNFSVPIPTNDNRAIMPQIVVRRRQ